MNHYERLIADADARPFTGWDTSLDGRITTVVPWSFEADVSAHARNAATMLDMGTGGGEWLAGLENRAPLTVATETWTPNVRVAARRLHGLGIPVVHADDVGDNTALAPGDRIALPFRDGSFALVSNRHESFDPYEIARVLAPAGIFLTQQVADGFNRDYYALLDLAPPALPAAPWRAELARAQLEGAGLVVDAAAEGDEEVIFHDVGAFAWYVKNLPWVLPGFIVGVHDPALRRLHARIERDGPIVARQALFRLRARRAA